MKEIINFSPSEGWIYLQFEGNPNGDRTWRSRPERENGIARFNLSWLLQGENTGDGERPAWLPNTSTRDSAAEKHPVPQLDSERFATFQSVSI